MPKVKYPGVAIAAGETLIVPALSFAQLEEHASLLDMTGDASLTPRERIGAKIHIIHAALTRNYSDITLAEVRQWLDLNTISTAFNAALGASEEAKTQGED